MEGDRPEDVPARRASMRRARSAGFSAGVSTSSESLQDAVDDEIDEPVDPREINRRIREQSREVANIARNGGFGAAEIEPNTPRQMTQAERLQQVIETTDADYSREYRQVQVHRMLMRNIPLDLIARELGVSVVTIQRDRTAIKQLMRDQAKALHIDEMVGGQSALYDEVSAQALAMSTDARTPTAMKLAAMRTALAANADRSRFLATAGVFDVLKFRQGDTGSALSDVQMLMQQTRDLIKGLREEEPAADTAVRPKLRPRTAPARFKPMSFDDTDASNSATENVDL